MLPKTSQDWRAFRSLCLKTHRCAIPEECRHREYYPRWEQRFAPALGRHVTLVREIHENAEYATRSPEGCPEGHPVVRLTATHDSRKETV